MEPIIKLLMPSTIETSIYSWFSFCIKESVPDNIQITMKIDDCDDLIYPPQPPVEDYYGSDIPKEFLDGHLIDEVPAGSGYYAVTHSSPGGFHFIPEAAVRSTVSVGSDGYTNIVLKFEYPICFGSTAYIKVTTPNATQSFSFNVSKRRFYSPALMDMQSPIEDGMLQAYQGGATEIESVLPAGYSLMTDLLDIFDDRSVMLSIRRVALLTQDSFIDAKTKFDKMKVGIVPSAGAFNQVHNPKRIIDISSYIGHVVLRRIHAALREFSNRRNIPTEWYEHMMGMLDASDTDKITRVQLLAMIFTVASRAYIEGKLG